MKRSDSISWSQVKVGILIVLALLFFAAGVLLLGEKTKFFIPKGRLSVIMTDVAGLKVGAPVWLAGVEVGIVRDIRFEQPEKTNEVEVVLEIERDPLKKIGRDSLITVKSRGLLGEKYVDITPSRFVTVMPETRLYGTSMVKVDDVMQRAGSAFDRLNRVAERMERGEGSLGRFAKDPKLYDGLVRLTTELNTFADSVNRGEGTMGRLVHDRKLYDRLVSLADRSEQAVVVIQELNRKITSPEGTIGKLLGEREFYDKGLALIERADRSMKALEEITARLKRGEGTAGRLLSERELYDKMDRMVTDVDLLVKDVKENPGRYLKFSLF